MQKRDFKQIPTSPGIYKFFKNRKLLYVGKAVNLRNRIKSYFSANRDSRIEHLATEANHLKYEIVNSEIEALILESQLIKRLKPFFNIKLRDDKRYFYVGISKEEFPRVFVTHQPFDHAERSRRVVLSLSKDNHPASLKASPFNKSKIKNWKLKTENSYIGPFTDGTALKTTLRLLRKIFPYCTCKQIHNVFCLNYHIGNCLGFCCLKDSSERSQRIAEIKHEYRKNIHAIRQILEGKNKTFLKNLQKEMENFAGKQNFEQAIKARQKIEKVERIFENAKIIRNTNLQIHANATNNNALKELKSYLGLSRISRRIEGYDIANIQGKFATGSMVVFTNGQPDKKEYKKFKIRSKTTPDDIAMLKEVLERRFNHQEWPMPDLIILDGGMGQLNLAIKILKLFKLKIPIIALTKDDKHRGSQVFLQTKKLPVLLDSLPTKVKNLILRVDDEAHRFAIHYYRKLHQRSVVNKA